MLAEMHCGKDQAEECCAIQPKRGESGPDVS